MNAPLSAPDAGSALTDLLAAGVLPEGTDGALLAELEHLAIELAVEAGQLVTARRPGDLGASTKSSRTDAVTAMDTASEALLRERLAARRPQDGVFGEEEAHTLGTSGLTWAVDPIDGTVNYLYGIPEYAVSVAVIAGDPTTPGAWWPLAGAVYDPSSGDCYHARVGGGAFVRYIGHHQGVDVPLAVRPDAPLPEALVATGFSYDSATRGDQARMLTTVLPAVRDIRRAGSAALDLCHLAQGRLDGYYEWKVNVWDVAAGAVVLTEAGGRVTGWSGGPLLGPGLVAATPGVHTELVALLDSAGRPETKG